MEQTIPPTLKRPPLTTASTSKSSLFSLEQTVMPFQEFIRRTPPVEESQKPLPPTPLKFKRSSHGGSPSVSSRDVSPSLPRRSSSIYSRTVSQWLPDSPIWSASDLADNPVPALPQDLLRPIEYSASTPNLVEKAAEPTWLQPRTYQPLLTTPSPTISRRTTPSPPSPSFQRQARDSVLLPTAVEAPEIPKSHLRTVSLEKAKAVLREHGAEHLLPEELRAKSKGKPIRKSRSAEQVVAVVAEPRRKDTLAMFGAAIDLPPTPPALPTMTLVDAEGRDRMVRSPRASVAPLPTFRFPLEPVRSPNPTVAAFPVGKNAPRTMFSLADYSRQQSWERVDGHPEPEYNDHDRGRIMQRGPRNSSFNFYQSNGRRRQSSSSARAEENTEQMVQEYHSLLAERYRQASASPASQSVKSVAAVGEHMRMVPQPLFHGKLPAMQAGEMRGRYDSVTGSSRPFHRREQSDGSLSRGSRSPMHGYSPSLPENMSMTKDLKRRSSMGEIPISPPFDMTFSSPMPPVPQLRKIANLRRNSNDNRVSAYWHIPTKGGNELLFRRSKEKKASMSRTGAPSPYSSPGVPLLPEDNLGQQLATPRATPDHSPLAQSPWPTKEHQAAYPTPSPKPAKEQTAKQALLSRITKGAVKYADKLTRPAGYEPRPRQQSQQQQQQRSQYEPITLQTLQNLTHAPVARTESPHLLHPNPACPPMSKQRPTHASKPSLGWSHAAKQAFDSANSHSTSRHKQQPSKATVYTHTLTPPRRLDERGTADESEDEQQRQGGGRASLFSTLRDFRLETKAEKRREEIKRSIRVVGAPVETAEVAVRGRSAEGQRVESRPGGWGRRSISWIGGGGGGGKV